MFAEDEYSRFSLTPLAENLRSDVTNSLRPFGIMAGAEFYQSWGNLLYSVKTGKQGFDKTFGKPFFQYMTEHPDRHTLYDEAMIIHGIAETEPMLDAYDFSAFETVIDVGGGNGLMLAAILKRYPTIKGILFDLPAVVDRAKATISDLDLSYRCQIIGGDFFHSVPSADVYVLRHIIHDWDDNEAISILRNCRKAMNPEGKILLVETVIPPMNEPCFGKWLDLMMLIVGGRERTEEQYRRLLPHAGLKLNRIISTAHEVSIVEAVSVS
jgi:2-polyprenyl-3-methyl-5-hydroxy-6-metoxy-1,4-benzoquinol methylase